MVIVNQDRGMPDIGLWLYALTQHSMTNRYAALNENMIYHCPHDVVPLYEKRLYSAFQFMHQLHSDTVAAIAGSIAEPYFGIPESMRSAALAYLDKEQRSIVERFEALYGAKVLAS